MRTQPTTPVDNRPSNAANDRPFIALVVIPTVATELVLQRYGSDRYTWLRLWGDLRKLNNRVLGGEFKVFVEQQRPESDPPKLFVARLSSGQDRDAAYLQGLERILQLLSAMILAFGYAFEPRLHEAMTVPLVPDDEIGRRLSIADIDVSTCNGYVSVILSPAHCVRSRAPFKAQMGPAPGYITTYMEIPTIEGPFTPTIPMSPSAPVDGFEQEIQRIFAVSSRIAVELRQTVASFYSAAISTESLPVSFLLLWQILESVGAAQDQGQPLIKDELWAALKAQMELAGLTAPSIERARGSLSRLREQSNLEIVSRMLRDIACPTEQADSVHSRVRKYWRLRGSIAHPAPERVFDEDELATYAALRADVTALMRALRE